MVLKMDDNHGKEWKKREGGEKKGQRCTDLLIMRNYIIIIVTVLSELSH